jgi:hypothetical protein
MSVVVTSPVTRCKWCIERTGSARYRFGSDWMTHILVPDHHITDGICPECDKGMREQIAALSLMNAGPQHYAPATLMNATPNNFHARLGLGQVAPSADGSCVAPQVGRQPLLSAALIRVLQFISRRRWSSSGRRRFYFFWRRNRRGHSLGKFLSLSHKEWRLSR